MTEMTVTDTAARVLAALQAGPGKPGGIYCAVLEGIKANYLQYGDRLGLSVPEIATVSDALTELQEILEALSEIPGAP